MSFLREGSCQKEPQDAAIRGAWTIQIRVLKLPSFIAVKIKYYFKILKKLENKYINISDVHFSEEIMLLEESWRSSLFWGLQNGIYEWLICDGKCPLCVKSCMFKGAMECVTMNMQVHYIYI